MQDFERMLFCDVCGADACFGFGVTVDGIRMGDVGHWRCADHHPNIKARCTREEWAQRALRENSIRMPALFNST